MTLDMQARRLDEGPLPDVEIVTDAVGARGDVMYDDAVVSQATERFAALEAAARLAIEAVTGDAGRQVARLIESSETRLVDALGLVEQQQRDLTRWREAMEQQLNEQVRHLGDWDEELHELKQNLIGMRELAEAALGVASDELERRWESLRRELTDILETEAGDERARWEAFMHSANETLASGSGIDPAEVDALRLDITTLRDAAAQSIAAGQQAQREQLATLRTELRTLLESERGQIITLLSSRVDEAQATFVGQAQQLQAWQDSVAAQLKLWQDGLGQEVEQGIHQTRAITRAEISGMRSDTERTMLRLRRQGHVRQILTLIIAILALLASAAAVALPFLHLP